MAKKKWYAVARGRKTGLYTTWPEAEREVKGFAGARFKGFATKEEALAWLEDPVRPQRKKTASNPPPAPGKSDLKGTVVFTDGSCLGNPGPGGYGVVILVDGKEADELSGGYRRTTNNRMEMMAVIKALAFLQSAKGEIRLFSDSSYLVNGLTKGWVKGWQKRDWHKSDGQPVANVDLWKQLVTLVDSRVKVAWVKGHAGNIHNERCDRLAVAAAEGKELMEDVGYELH